MFGAKLWEGVSVSENAPKPCPQVLETLYLRGGVYTSNYIMNLTTTLMNA
jgi:hypothetical protein